MKIVTTRESLLEPLQQIAGVVERRQTLPILANILVNVSNGTMNLTATDLEVELKTKAEAESEGDIDFTIPARKILDICKSLPDDAKINLDLDKDKAKLRSGKSRFTLSVLPARDYPVIEPTASSSVFKIKENILKRLIEKTQFAMAQQDVRYYLNGMLLELRSGDIRTVATDGHRLAMSERKSVIPEDIDMQIILPRKAVIELSRLLNDHENDIQVELSNNYIRVVLSNAVFVSKLIDGRFPDYQRVMPADSDKLVKVDKTQFKQSLSRASILSNEKYRGIRFSIDPGILQLQAHNPEQEEAEEELDINYDGDNLKIGFNVGYLLDAIGAISENDVVIELKDSNSSALIYGEGNNESKYVVMPMRI